MAEVVVVGEGLRAVEKCAESDDPTEIWLTLHEVTH